MGADVAPRGLHFDATWREASRDFARVALLLYVGFIFYGGTLPWDLDLRPEAVSRRLSQVNLELIHVEDGRVRGVPDMVANLLFFAPLGCFMVLARAPRRRPLRAIAEALLAGVALSICVEGLQLLTRDRFSQLRDVVLNGAGCAGGAAAVVWFEARFEAATVAALRRAVQRAPGLLVAAGYLGLLLVDGVLPLDVSLDVDSLRTSLRHFFDDPIGSPEPGALLRPLIAFGVAGAVLARAAALAPWQATTLAGVWAAGIELTHFIVDSRTPQLAPVVAGVLGAAAGSALAARPRPIASAPGALIRELGPAAFTLFVVYLATAALAPYRPAPALEVAAKLDWRALVPFWHQYRALTVPALGELGAALLSFVPFGYIFAALRGGVVDPRQVARGAALYASALAAAFELAQLPIAGGVPDVTDVLAAALGASAGAVALHQLGRLQAAGGARDGATSRRDP